MLLETLKDILCERKKVVIANESEISDNSSKSFFKVFQYLVERKN